MKLVGRILFWLSWPLQWIYFKLYPLRTRVLIVAGGKVLIIKPFMGPNKWMLPGGGLKRGESEEKAAVREVEEEVGVVLEETQLKLQGRRKFKMRGLSYRTVNFSVELDKKPEVKLRSLEVRSYSWVKFEELEETNVAREVLFNVRRFTPTEQASLL